MQINRKIIFFVLIINIFILFGCTNNKILKYRNEAIWQYKEGNYEEALNLFESSLNIGKGKIGSLQYDILLYKAECLIRLNRPYEAREIYEVLLKVDKNNKDYKDLHDMINNSLYLVDFKKALDDDNIEEALKIYEKIQELGLEHEKSVMFNRAVLYEKQGKWKEANNAFLIYQKSYPDDEDCKKEISFIENQINEYVEPTIETKEETKKDEKNKKK